MGIRGRVQYEFHFYLYRQLAEHVHPRRLVNTKEAKSIISNGRNIPKPLRLTLLNEMEQLGWIEWVTRDVIKLKRPVEIQ